MDTEQNSSGRYFRFKVMTGGSYGRSYLDAFRRYGTPKGENVYVLPSGDVIHAELDGDSPSSFEMNILLSGPERSLDVKRPRYETIWVPREYFSAFREAAVEGGRLVGSREEDPRRHGEPYHFSETYIMNATCDKVEIFYLDRNRSRIGDVRCHFVLD